MNLPDFKKQVEKEFYQKEKTVWQFAGEHPDFKNHTVEMVREFLFKSITEAWELGKKETIAEVEKWAEKSLDMFEETILINFLQTLKDKE